MADIKEIMMKDMDTKEYVPDADIKQRIVDRFNTLIKDIAGQFDNHSKLYKMVSRNMYVSYFAYRVNRSNVFKTDDQSLCDKFIDDINKIIGDRIVFVRWGVLQKCRQCKNFRCLDISEEYPCENSMHAENQVYGHTTTKVHMKEDFEEFIPALKLMNWMDTLDKRSFSKDMPNVYSMTDFIPNEINKIYELQKLFSDIGDIKPEHTLVDVLNAMIKK